MEASVPHAVLRRPNRTAAQRRAQRDRAHVRLTSKLLALQRSMHHRGAEEPKIFTETVSYFMEQSSSSSSATPSTSTRIRGDPPSSHLEPSPKQTSDILTSLEQLTSLVYQQCGNIQWQLIHMSSQIQSLHSWLEPLEEEVLSMPAGELEQQPKHGIANLLDNHTLQRIQSLHEQGDTSYVSASPIDDIVDRGQALRLKTYVFTRNENPADENPAAPSPPSAAETIQWWSCQVCGYKLPSETLLKKHGGKCCQIDDNRIAHRHPGLYQPPTPSTYPSSCQLCNGTGWISKFQTCSRCTLSLATSVMAKTEEEVESA